MPGGFKTEVDKDGWRHLSGKKAGPQLGEACRTGQWGHVSVGELYRSMFLPFEPEEGAVEAHFDKGVLHLTIKKPAKAVKTTKTINVKTGVPPSPSPELNKAAAPGKAA